MIRKSLLMLLAAVVSVCSVAGYAAAADKEEVLKEYPVVEGRWPAAKANAWYAKLPWLVGCNYYPATAINQIDMWQASTWDPETIDKELGWAESIGMNTLRVYLHDMVWADDEQGLYKRMDEFLDICQKHGIRPFFVFFDDCHFPNPMLGEQPAIVKAFHNSGWVNCPAREVAIRFAQGKASDAEVAQLKGYVQGTIRRFKDDKRVLFWELYNEPGRGRGIGDDGGLADGNRATMGDHSNKLVHASWVWAREVNPSQPISSCTEGSVGEGNIIINRTNSDIHSIHNYGPPKELEKTIKEYIKDGRPVIMTEWLARTRKSTVQDCLPILKKYNVGAVNWGFVSGESGTIWPWSSRHGKDVNEERAKGNVVKPGEAFPEPELWFHDIFRVDGTPFDQEEIDTFRALTGAAKKKANGKGKPNVVFIFIDDMGYGDLSCFGNEKVATPNIDKLADAGLKLTNFYVNSPICSPSRVAVHTGIYPGRWGVHAHFDSKHENKRRGMVDFLNPKTPTLAKAMKKAGYATGHFGKWHMGGGRDVVAPLPQEYGYDESYVSFEGLGDRQLFNNHGLSDQSTKLGHGEITFVDKCDTTKNYVDKALDFIKRKKDGGPFYVNLFPNDVHDPHLPADGEEEKYKDIASNNFEQDFFAVLVEMDKQIGRFLDGLKEMGLEEDTIVVLTSDNGPTDWPRYYKAGVVPPGSTGPFYGRKWSLYEGGIHEPFIIRWPGRVPAGKVNEKSIACGIDIFPSLCAMAGVEVPKEFVIDGVDMSKAFMGQEVARRRPIFWEYPRVDAIRPGNKDFVSPDLAMRAGKWKLLMNKDGSDVKLFDLKADIGETNNLAAKKPKIVERMTKRLMNWRKSVAALRTN